MHHRDLPAVVINGLSKIGKKVEDVLALRRTRDCSVGDALTKPGGEEDTVPIVVTEQGDMCVGAKQEPKTCGWTACTIV